MYIPKDPFMLLSFINTQLRDNYKSLDDFCKANDVDKQEILAPLTAAGYFYDPKANCFSEK